MANPNGRPSKFDETTAQLIALNYAQGLPLRIAAQAAGISHATAKAWVKESRENPTGPKGTFWPLMRAARANAIASAAQASRKTDPKWWLARMLPKEFGDPAKKLEVEVAGSKIGVVILPPEDP